MTVFELAKVIGTPVAMIEPHYGTLIGGAHAGIVGRLDATTGNPRASRSAILFANVGESIAKVIAAS